MKYVAGLASLLLFLFAGCKKEADVTGITGVYNQEFKTTFLAATKHQINFIDNAHFQMKLQRISDTTDAPGITCKSNRTDYAKGSYTISGNIIRFEGKYCDENYNTLQPICDGTTDYEMQYDYKRNGSFLILDFNKDQNQQIWLKPE